MARRYRYVSADSHFESPPDMWTHRVPAKYRDRAPRRIKLSNGKDAIVEEGRPPEVSGTNQFAGKSPEEFSPVGLDFDNARGAGSPEERLKEQDADGIDAEVLYATEGQYRHRDRDAFLAIVRALHDNSNEEFCGGRRIASSAPPWRPTPASTKTSGVEALWDMGFKTARLHTFTKREPQSHARGRPLLAAALETGHRSRSTRRSPRTRWAHVYHLSIPGSRKGRSGRPIFLQRIARHGIYHCARWRPRNSFLDGVSTLPRLRIYWARTKNRLDTLLYQQNGSGLQSQRFPWAERLLGLKRFPAFRASISGNTRCGASSTIPSAWSYGTTWAWTRSCGPRTSLTS